MADTSIFERKFDPLYQAGFALVGVLVMNLIGIAARGTNAIDVTYKFPWMCAASFMLFFAVFNAVFSVTSKSMVKYWGRSIYAFMGLGLGAGLMAWAFSGISIGEAGSYRWIYVVVTFGYLIFLSMVTMMRSVVDFAQKEEWNSPKIRQKKRRR